MKFKQFKKEINQDSDLLKLSGKELAAIFEIDVLKAKYFKKRYKEELQFAVEFDINTGKTGKDFYVDIDLQSCFDLGLKINSKKEIKVIYINNLNNNYLLLFFVSLLIFFFFFFL